MSETRKLILQLLLAAPLALAIAFIAMVMFGHEATAAQVWAAVGLFVIGVFTAASAVQIEKK